MSPPRGTLREVAGVFFKLGCIAFGGPAAHVAMMREEIVRRRKWVAEEQFLDLFGLSSLIPGPSSTELAIFLAYLRAGVPGLVVGGALFILPAMLLVLALAWLYVRYGSLPATAWLLYGIKPVAIAIVVYAVTRLGRTAITKYALLAVALLSILGFYAGLNPLAVLIAGGALYLTFWQLRSSDPPNEHPATTTTPVVLATTSVAASKVAALPILLAFLKIGAFAFGGGYILLAFLQGDLVHSYHWLSNRQVIDAVAVGQVTPGPVFTTATFLGYLLGGIPGAILATLGIFLPSFVYVAVLFPFAHRLRSAPRLATFMDGVNCAAVGLMAAATLTLAHDALIDPFTVTIFAAALLLTARFHANAAVLVLSGALAGILIKVIHP
jgi:chromate transporter